MSLMDAPILETIYADRHGTEEESEVAVQWPFLGSKQYTDNANPSLAARRRPVLILVH